MTNHIKVALIGATGKAGSYLLKTLLNQGYTVKALIRNPSSYNYLHPNLEIVRGDIKDLETANELIKNCGVVISALGQAKDEPLIASVAAQNIIKAMNKQQIKRYIFLTGLNIDVPGDKKSMKTVQASTWMKETFPVFVADKEKAFEIVKMSGLDWTMVRLPWIEQTEEVRNLTVSLEDSPGEKISTTDLAHFLIDQILETDFIGKAPFVASL
ncbi:NAD(P)-dependent oxidoreductase [Pedobacter panaciterrae]|jgi:Putative NADH-flavin reductase|uniref:NAD(P)-dependent oxidoreductase n=1 Tax=Pedobacter panaciterrae TaxID=363849 RepID=UPI00155DA2AF|nr:NAD(P)H-binding protein [Pedobacter panaciterrae]NQX55680.1 NAD(P)H-binding protein [Pedobacter panaciterrae]